MGAVAGYRCGRLFEGTPAEMHASLAKFDSLPDHTLVLCAHEYTQSNADFCLSIDGDNTALVVSSLAVSFTGDVAMLPVRVRPWRSTCRSPHAI